MSDSNKADELPADITEKEMNQNVNDNNKDSQPFDSNESLSDRAAAYVSELRDTINEDLELMKGKADHLEESLREKVDSVKDKVEKRAEQRRRSATSS